MFMEGALIVAGINESPVNEYTTALNCISMDLTSTFRPAVVNPGPTLIYVVPVSSIN
jgi:hypothetical protein